jgi:DNA polymerase alpha subunit A
VDKDAPYIDMYWMDVSERQGDVLLFGKVPHNGVFVSACCAVRGCVRNLYVLPRPDSGGLQRVHAEVGGMLKSVLPQRAGVSWRGKPVIRKYAFDDPDVPKAKQQYLKVVYSSHYPSPSPDSCRQGGVTFSKILNYSASTVETFLIKRQLRGPCWIRLRNPTLNQGSISHCKAEFQVMSYKDVAVLTENAPPPPPVTTLTLKFQTVPGGGNKTEIVSVAAVCHKNVSLEGSSDPRHVHQLCLIRPLAGTPFPRDMDREIIPQVRKEINERAMLSRLLAQIGQVRLTRDA